MTSKNIRRIKIGLNLALLASIFFEAHLIWACVQGVACGDPTGQYCPTCSVCGSMTDLTLPPDQPDTTSIDDGDGGINVNHPEYDSDDNKNHIEASVCGNNRCFLADRSSTPNFEGIYTDPGFTDEEGNTFPSLGSITWSNASGGTWSWSLPSGYTASQVGSGPITITDASGQIVQLESNGGGTINRGSCQINRSKSDPLVPVWKMREQVCNGLPTRKDVQYITRDGSNRVQRVRTTTITQGSLPTDPLAHYKLSQTARPPQVVTTVDIYYGYDLPQEQENNEGKLHYRLSAADVARYLKLNAGNGVNPSDPAAQCGLDTTAETNLDDYASVTYLAYDANGRPMQVQGGGCQVCGGGGESGDGIYEIRFIPIQGNNNWNLAKRMLAPSGLQTVEFYKNWKLVLKVEQLPGSAYAFTHTVYDAAGRVEQVRHPSACLDYSVSATQQETIGQTEYTWVSNVTIVGNGTHSTNGLVELTEYSSQGNVTARKVRQGIAGTTYWLAKNTYGSSTSYDARGNATAAVEHLLTATTYPKDATEDNDSSALTSTYAYRFYKDGSNHDTHAIKFMKVTYPTVTTAQNGPNTATSIIYHYQQVLDGEDPNNDVYYQDWTLHEDGTLSYRQVWPDERQTRINIQDVQTDGSGYVSGETEYDGTGSPPTLRAPADDFVSSGNPVQWTSTAGLHLKTSYVYDNAGRLTSVTDPAGRRSVTAYIDWKVTSGSAQSTRGQVTLTTPSMVWSGTGENEVLTNYNQLPLSITVSDPAGRTLYTAEGIPSDNTDGDLTDDWNASASDFGDNTGKLLWACLSAGSSTTMTARNGLLPPWSGAMAVTRPATRAEINTPAAMNTTRTRAGRRW